MYTIETKGARQRPSQAFHRQEKGVQPAQALSEFSPLFPAVNVPFCYTAIENRPSKTRNQNMVMAWHNYLLSSRI